MEGRECWWSKLHALGAKEMQARRSVLVEAQVGGPQPGARWKMGRCVRRDCSVRLCQAGCCVWSCPGDHWLWEMEPGRACASPFQDLYKKN